MAHEAMVSAAAAIAVVYPQMNGLGGDAFWTVKPAGQDPFCIMGCGRAAGLATPDWYRARGYATAMPTRGAHAALTVPGAVGSWDMALDAAPGRSGRRLSDLLKPAIGLAREGTAISRHQATMTAEKINQLKDVTGFAHAFLDDGAAPDAGHALRQPAFAQTLEQVGTEGVQSFYHGDIAATHAAFLEEVGSPLRASDFANHAAQRQDPLQIKTSLGTLYNTAPPTQGMASLAILGVFDRLGVTEGESFAHIHGMVEAIKQAYIVRNRALGDPDEMTEDPQTLLSDASLSKMARAIDPQKARGWPELARAGDTVWMGAIDKDGTAVSFIQSIFWDFGSGLVCPETGVLFQNRGADFLLEPGPRALAPGRLPFHTLNPAMAAFDNGRVMAYGTQGGEGQPQTQSAIYSRYAYFDSPLQEAICRPRWLLGKSWGEESTTLKVESDFDPALIKDLKNAGHDIEIIPPCNPVMGQAGAVLRHPDGAVEAATDPRSDGAALAV